MLRSKEKRRIVRWEIQRPVRFKQPGQEEENIAMLKDISFTGARISVLESLRLHEDLDMVMEIPDEDNPISCQAKIVWQNAAADTQKPRFFCGLNFTRINDFDKEKIFNYIWKTTPEEIKRQWGSCKK